jgi:hypothetical protein
LTRPPEGVEKGNGRDFQIRLKFTEIMTIRKVREKTERKTEGYDYR